MSESSIYPKSNTYAANRGTSPHDERDRSFTPAQRHDAAQWAREGRGLPCETDGCPNNAEGRWELCRACQMRMAEGSR